MRSELEIVGEIAEALSTSPTVQQALDRTLELVTRLLGLDTGWVWLVNPETGHIYSAAARNLPPYLQEPERMSGASCWCITEFRDGSLSPRNVDVIECGGRASSPRPESSGRFGTVCASNSNGALCDPDLDPRLKGDQWP